MLILPGGLFGNYPAYIHLFCCSWRHKGTSLSTQGVHESPAWRPDIIFPSQRTPHGTSFLSFFRYFANSVTFWKLSSRGGDSSIFKVRTTSKWDCGCSESGLEIKAASQGSWQGFPPHLRGDESLRDVLPRSLWGGSLKGKAKEQSKEPRHLCQRLSQKPGNSTIPAGTTNKPIL